MKRNYAIILLLSGIIGLTMSCNKQETYADKLKNETKAIDKLIAKNRFTVLKNFPKDTVFKANEFYRDPATGVYFNIIDRGDLTKRPKLGDEVYVRYSGLIYFMRNDTVEFNNWDPYKNPDPNQIGYAGPVSMLNKSLYSATVAGWVVPLPYVGRQGKVQLIIPFNMGSSAETSNFQPSYYKEVTYTQIKSWAKP